MIHSSVLLLNVTQESFTHPSTVEPLNNGHGRDEHFVHCLEVVLLLEVEMYGQLMAGGRQAVCPL